MKCLSAPSSRSIMFERARPQSFCVIAVVSAALVASSAALALGFGEAELESRLFSPLRAYVPIDLGDASATSLRLSVTPVNPAAAPVVAELIDGVSPVVRLFTLDPVREPMLLLRLQASDGVSQTTREITLLLDMPPAAATVAAGPAGARSSRPAGRSLPGDRYGPVRAGETLSEIAYALKSRYGQSTWTVAMALYAANPSAFGGSIDTLRRGAVLQLPRRITPTNTSARAASIAPAVVAAGRAAAQRAPAAGERARGRLQIGRIRVVDARPAAVVAGELRAEQEAARAAAARQRAADALRAEQARLREIEAAERAAEAAEWAALTERSAATTTRAVVASSVAPEAAGAVEPASTPAEPNAAASPEREPRPASAVQPVEAAPAPEQSSTASAAPSLARPGQGGPARIGSTQVSLASVLGLLGLLAASLALALLWMRRRGQRPDPEHVQAAVTPAASTRSTRPATPSVEQAGVLQADAHSAQALDSLDVSTPHGEATLHTLYGEYDQAEAVLRRAIAAESNRELLVLELLKLHQRTGNRDAFIALAYSIERESARSDTQAQLWRQAYALGQSFLVNARLFGGAGIPEEAGLTDLDDADVDFDLTADMEPARGGGQPGNSTDQAGSASDAARVVKFSDYR